VNRTRKVVAGLGAAIALLAAGGAVAAPAVAQTDPGVPDPAECPYECPLDRDQARDQDRDQVRERMHEHLRDGQRSPWTLDGGTPHHGYGPGGGTCRLAGAADIDG
jgi:hypothetical protein